MSPENDNPLFFAAEVDFDDLDNALSSAESSYVSMSEQVEKATKAFEEQGQESKKTGGKIKGAARAALDDVKALGGGIKRVGRGTVKALGREKKAVEELGLSWGSLGSIIGGAAVIGIIGKAIKDFLTFDRLIRSTSTVLGDHPRLYAAASASIQKFTGYLDMSREELVEITKLIGELRLIRENTRMGAAAFRAMVKDVVHLGKAMDVSTSSVVDLFDTFTRVYGLPHHRLRGIAASMKFIQENTAISGEELMSFAKNLDDVLAQMTGAAGLAKEEATKDLIAMAGAFKDAGLDPTAISGLFAEALNVDSEQGQQWLAFITKNTQYGMDQMRRMIEKGDVVTPMELFIKQLKKDGPEALKWNRQFYMEMTGMTFAQLTKVMQMDEDAVADLIERRKKAMKNQEYLAQRAKRVQNGLLTMWNELKRAFESLWLAVGKRLTEFVSRHAPAVIKAITGWVNWITSPAGGEKIKGFFAAVGRIGSKVFKVLGQIWEKYFQAKLEWLLTPQGGDAVEKWFSDAVDTIAKMADGIAKVAKIISDIKDSLKTEEERALEYTHEREAMFERMRGSFEKMIATEMKAKGVFKFEGIEMAATRANIKKFMGTVAQRKLAEFTRDIERAYPRMDPRMKAELVKSYGQTLRSQLALGYAPLMGPAFEKTEAIAKKPVAAAPAVPPRVEAAMPTPAVGMPKIAPKVVTPTAAPAPAATAKTVVQVQPDRSGNALLARIDDKLGRIDQRGAKPKKTPQQQLAEEPLMP